MKSATKLNSLFSGVPGGVRGVRTYPLRMLSALFLMLSAPFCTFFHFKIKTFLKVFYNFTKFLYNFI